MKLSRRWLDENDLRLCCRREEWGRWLHAVVTYIQSSRALRALSIEQEVVASE